MCSEHSVLLAQQPAIPVSLFSTQNQVPQVIIGNGGVIHDIKALSVVIRMTFKNVEKCFKCREKPV